MFEHEQQRRLRRKNSTIMLTLVRSRTQLLMMRTSTKRCIQMPEIHAPTGRQPTRASAPGHSTTTKLVSSSRVLFISSVPRIAILSSVLWHHWLSVRKSIRPVKYMSGEVLAWLRVWREVQMICVWSSWCHCHSIISCFVKIHIDLTFLVLAYPGYPGKRVRLSRCLSSTYSYYLCHFLLGFSFHRCLCHVCHVMFVCICFFSMTWKLDFDEICLGIGRLRTREELIKFLKVEVIVRFRVSTPAAHV